jgi:hypothetical protein
MLKTWVHMSYVWFMGMFNPETITCSFAQSLTTAKQKILESSHQIKPGKFTTVMNQNQVNNPIKEKVICSLCGLHIEDTSYSSWPFVDEADVKENKCCKQCYEKEVKPAIKAMARLYDTY